jgi:hypothetical protein
LTPGSLDFLWRLLGVELSPGLTPVALSEIRCFERDLALSLELATELPVASSGWIYGSSAVRPPATGTIEKRMCPAQSGGLDQGAIEVKRAEQLFERCLLTRFTR